MKRRFLYFEPDSENNIFANQKHSIWVEDGVLFIPSENLKKMIERTEGKKWVETFLSTNIFTSFNRTIHFFNESQLNENIDYLNHLLINLADSEFIYSDYEEDFEITRYTSGEHKNILRQMILFFELIKKNKLNYFTGIYS